MDQWIRFGLLAAWLVFGIAVLIWWWRRRYASRRYPYSERAVTINQALEESADLGVIYWSKSEKRFLRRIITPLELDGYSLKAFDHTANDVRIFQVTRIKTLELVVRGSEHAPSLKSTTRPVWALAGLGVVAIALLAVVLYRGRGTTDETPPLPPPSPDVLPAAVSTALLARAEMSTAGVTSVIATDVAPPDVTEPVPVPELPSTKVSQDRWDLVVYDRPMYDTNFLARALLNLLSCSPSEAEGFVQQIRGTGRAVVWGGKWTSAEVLRQTLDAQDIVSKVEPVEPKNSSDASAPR